MTLEQQLQEIDAVGQISSPSGEEIVSTCPDNQSSRLTKLTNAYVDLDAMAKSLKLGSLQQVITAAKDDQSFTVQSKSVKGQGDDQEALLNTVIGQSLQGALVADGIVRDTTQQILQ